jgi:regulator of sirC expression with transglutaminase-like and TPR domain
MNTPALIRELEAALSQDPLDLANCALMIAKIEYPRLNPEPTLSRLDGLGRLAATRLDPLAKLPIRDRIEALNHLLFDEEQFAGNQTHYADFRNSLLNIVVERRRGIPITLALVYLEVARRAGLSALGISFPGHFLVRVPNDDGDAVILDPFNGGREIGEAGCRALFRRHVGRQARFSRSLLEPCSGRQLLARMLNNLKRTYVEQRSFPQARDATSLLCALDPSLESELRDRGLLAYHLDDYPSALRDLEHYLRRRSWDNTDRDEHERVLEHVKTLRGRVAGLN